LDERDHADAEAQKETRDESRQSARLGVAITARVPGPGTAWDRPTVIHQGTVSNTKWQLLGETPGREQQCRNEENCRVFDHVRAPD
jgi:hypothetical protein